MDFDSDIPHVAMQVSQGVIVASIQIDLDEQVLARFTQDLLERIQQSGARGVILDVSGLELVDANEFEALRRIIAMGNLLGAESIMTGMRPGVVASLIETGANTDGLRAAIDLDAAFELLRPPVESPEESEDDSDPEQRPDEAEPDA